MDRWRIVVEITYDGEVTDDNLGEIKQRLEEIRRPPIAHYHILKQPHRCFEFD